MIRCHSVVRKGSAPALRGRARIAVLGVVCVAVVAVGLLATRRGPAPAAVAWRFGVAKGEVYRFGADPRHVAVAFLDANSGTVPPDTYQLAVLSGSTGEIEWRQPIDGAPSSSPIALDRDLVVVNTITPTTASRGRDLVARDARSGKLRWKAPVPEELASLAHLILTEDEVVGFAPRGNVWALAKDTGEQRWTAQVPRIPPDSPVRVESDRVLVFWGEPDPPYDVGVDCFSLKTGKRLWHRVTSSGRRLAYLRGLAEGGRVVFMWEAASASGPMKQLQRVEATCVRAATGEPVWTGALPYADLVFVAGKSIYGVTGDTALAGKEHTLWRADVRTGKLQSTSRRAPAMAFLPHPWAPLIARGMVAMEVRGEGKLDLRDMRVVWLDLRTGEVVGDYKGTTHGLAASEFALSDGRVICRTGGVRAIAALSPPGR